MRRGLDRCYIPHCCIDEDDEEAEMIKNGTSEIRVWWPLLLLVHKRRLKNLYEKSLRFTDRRGRLTP